MPAPPHIAITYHSSEEDNTFVEISPQRKLKHYYLNLLRIRQESQSNDDDININGSIDSEFEDSGISDDDNNQFEDSNSNPTASRAYEYNKISILKDYAGKYFQNHKIWTPYVNTDPLIEQLSHNGVKIPAEIQASEFSSMEVFDESKFLNYLHLPKTMGSGPLPPLIYHSSCEVNGDIYLLGGATTLIKGNNNEIIDDFSDFIITNTLHLPKPINSNLLNHPSVIPNNELYLVSSETSLVSKLKASGDIPPPLLAMSASKITNRHIFYYGGFEIVDDIQYNPETKKIYIHKSVKLNNSGYVLDVVSLKFIKFELIAHPNMITRYPLTVPRFGHSSSSVNLSKHLNVKQGSASTNIAATVFIMGGFRQDLEDPNNFKPIRDLWKVELSIIYKGKHDFVKFGENVLATPIPGPLEDDSIPSARAFHSAEIYDSSVIHNPNILTNTTSAHNNEKAPFNPNKIGIARPSSPASSFVSSNSTISNRRTNHIEESSMNLKLVVHGGTDGFQLFGDCWIFDFDEETWTLISTYFHHYEQFSLPRKNFYKCQLKRAGHRAVLIDKFIYIVGGAMPSDFPDSGSNSEDNGGIPDISPMVASLKGQEDNQNIKNDHYQRLFILNLSTNTWSLVKYFHGILPLVGTSMSLTSFGNIGSTVTQTNSKVFVIGGQLVPHNRSDDVPTDSKLNYLHGGVSIFEFPLGGSLAGPKI